MTCRSCVFHVTSAVQAVDPAAVVTVDLRTQTINVDSRADAEAVARSIEDAGYPVLEIRTLPGATSG